MNYWREKECIGLCKLHLTKNGEIIWRHLSMLCTNKCTAASYCRSRNNCRSIDIIIIIVVIIILVIIIMKLAISFSKLRLETDEIKLTLKNRFWQLCLLTNNYSTILHFFGNMIFQSIFHAIIALVKYVFLTALY